MKYTGERMIPEKNSGTQVYVDHMTRYLFAAGYVENKVVLDVACGTGYGSKILLKEGRAKKVVGVDIDFKSINYATKKYGEKNIDFIFGDCKKIPLKDDSFDVVVSFETIEHIEEQKAFLKEIRRVLKKNGLLIISSPNKKTIVEKNKFHKKELELNGLMRLISESFGKIKSLSQRPFLGSTVQEMNAGRKGNNLRYGSEGMPNQAFYFIILASNKRIPEIKTASFESFNKELLKEQKQMFFLKKETEKIQELLNIIKEKEKKIEETESKIIKLRSSKILRIVSFLNTIKNFPANIYRSFKKAVKIFTAVFLILFVYLFWIIIIIFLSLTGRGIKK